jgi:hypothetical protein
MENKQTDGVFELSEDALDSVVGGAAASPNKEPDWDKVSQGFSAEAAKDKKALASAKAGSWQQNRDLANHELHTWAAAHPRSATSHGLKP